MVILIMILIMIVIMIVMAIMFVWIAMVIGIDCLIVCVEILGTLYSLRLCKGEGVTNPFGLVGSARFVCRNACKLSACVCKLSACVCGCVESLSSRCRWLTPWAEWSLAFHGPHL